MSINELANGRLTSLVDGIKMGKLNLTLISELAAEGFEISLNGSILSIKNSEGSFFLPV